MSTTINTDYSADSCADSCPNSCADSCADQRLDRNPDGNLDENPTENPTKNPDKTIDKKPNEKLDEIASSQELLKIGEVRSHSGCSIQTIRYYESLGLIRSTDRTTGGFRLFAPTTLDRLAFIKQAQALGMSLQDISELLSVYDSGHAPCSTVKCKLRDKLADVDQRILALERLRHELQSLLAVADDLERSPGNICPIVERANQLNQSAPVEP